jgi:hypothetical protein
MPTLIANVYAEINVVLEALSSVGLSCRNPLTKQIYVWNEEERLVAESEASAIDAWRSGGLLQLWEDEENDLSIGHGENCVRLYFDGCTAREVAIYLSPLMSRSIEYWVGPEE